MCTYYYLHHHHSAPCTRDIEFAFHYVFCPAATFDETCRKWDPCQSVSYYDQQNGNPGVDFNNPCASGGCLASAECSLGQCRLEELNGLWDAHHGAKKHRESSSRDSKDKRSNSPTKRRPCRNLTSQSIAYPLPPSFQGSPSAAASSPLLPKCTLPRCPFELRNRCWNCCWCGKGWNEQGRCSCVMIIEGNEVRCEHICCETCTPAGLM
ncbi:hypothetical protein VSDG_06336 [Cytospora chrysosperma]|uniref:Uncharacterized protein n=1 Tax=Cytospora chrysosperma TaxID=252740 RepID=A0A423VPC3_CYTCH|nr:hypothetical protein VSDG_06336 [Valsa sordida]